MNLHRLLIADDLWDDDIPASEVPDAVQRAALSEVAREDAEVAHVTAPSTAPIGLWSVDLEATREARVDGREGRYSTTRVPYWRREVEVLVVAEIAATRAATEVA